MYLTIVLVIALFLWLLTLVVSGPNPEPAHRWTGYAGWLAFIAVLCLTLILHGVRF